MTPDPAPTVFAAIIILAAAIAAAATSMILRHHLPPPPPPPLPRHRMGGIAPPPMLVIAPARQGWRPAPPGTNPLDAASLITVVVMLTVAGAITITLCLLGEVRAALAGLALVLAAVALSAAGYATGHSGRLHSGPPASRHRDMPSWQQDTIDWERGILDRLGGWEREFLGQLDWPQPPAPPAKPSRPDDPGRDPA